MRSQTSTLNKFSLQLIIFIAANPGKRGLMPSPEDHSNQHNNNNHNTCHVISTAEQLKLNTE